RLILPDPDALANALRYGEERIALPCESIRNPDFIHSLLDDPPLNFPVAPHHAPPLAELHQRLYVLHALGEQAEVARVETESRSAKGLPLVVLQLGQPGENTQRREENRRCQPT